MLRRTLTLVLVAVLALIAAGCGRRNKVQNPIADLGSKQPDKVLYDRAMEAMKRGKYDVARLSLQTLINTYPDSEYVARAKLSVGDAWYAEGGSTGLAQAEIEYKDFITFFPNMPEAAEAQLKVANIHYRQMEKPDRDFTHAKRAEDEYKQFLLQFPDADAKLMAEAKQRLLEVQEVLAEREFRIGRFYFLRQSYPPAIARLRTLVDGYPLYSGADEALYLLGESYENLIAMVRANARLPEAAKGKLVDDYTRLAAEAYSRIITRYPATDRVGEAKERLAAMKQPIPEPTAEAIAQNEAEEKSRRELGIGGKMMGMLRKSPDVSAATKVGEPVLEEPRQVSPTDVARELTQTLRTDTGGDAPTGEVGLEATSGKGAPGENQPPPSSEPRPALNTAPAQEQQQGTSATGEQPPPAPTQTNEAASGDAQQAAGEKAGAVDKKTESTSKKKKKSGLRKLIPF